MYVLWPETMNKIEIPHRTCLESREADVIKAYHPKRLALITALKAHRKHEDVNTTACIALPVSVETHIHAKLNLAWKENPQE